MNFCLWMGREVTIYEVRGCLLFSSKAQPDEFGWEERLHGMATTANIGAISLLQTFENQSNRV